MGREGSWRESLRHVATFAHVSLDRLMFVCDKTGDFQVERHGTEHLIEATREGKGAILLGAHMGSFEAMHAYSRDSKVPINIVVDEGNSALMQGVLNRLSPDRKLRLISLAGGTAHAVLTIRERLGAGEFVAILADRVPKGGPSVDVDFMGAPAAFPVGPLVVASLCRCPVFLVVGLYRGGRDYELHCEPFADAVVLPRGDREPALARYVAQYAQRLEHYMAKAPYNWFNFYAFWRRP